jgi:aspartyl-tRNA(Asn)/glutamyl-tRNA(Gln) amidotransferase subunit A
VELYELTIDEAHQLLKNKDISSKELTHAVLDRIDAVENKIDAFIMVSRELALQQADQADAMIARGDSTPLTGIPLGIKDLMCTRNLATCWVSKIILGFLPLFDATFILK